MAEGGGRGVSDEVLVEDCVQAVTLAPVLVAGLEESFPGVYSAEELACLAEGYVGLGDEEVAVLTSGGVFPGGEDAGEAAVVLAGLFDGCGAVLPPELEAAVAGG